MHEVHFRGNREARQLRPVACAMKGSRDGGIEVRRLSDTRANESQPVHTRRVVRWTIRRQLGACALPCLGMRTHEHQRANQKIRS